MSPDLRTPSRRTAIIAGLGGVAALGFPRATRAQAADPYAILDDPQVRNPFEWVEAIAALWRRGDRLQAAFWYYVFQVRSRPWAEADMAQTGGSGAAALRSSITYALGAPINEWLGSDPATWRDTGARAIDFEKRLPFHAARPEGIDEATWARMNETARAGHEAGFDQVWRQYSFADLEARRRQAGLYVGPLQDPGQPLRW
jgi:hypothetical protein